MTITYHEFPEDWEDLATSTGRCTRCGTAIWLVIRSSFHEFSTDPTCQEPTTTRPAGGETSQ